MGPDNGSIYGSQGNTHIYVILNESCTKSITEHDIRDDIKAHKLEAGIPCDLFSNNLGPLEKI